MHKLLAYTELGYQLKLAAVVASRPAFKFSLAIHYQMLIEGHVPVLVLTMIAIGKMLLQRFGSTIHVAVSYLNN